MIVNDDYQNYDESCFIEETDISKYVYWLYTVYL